MSQDEIERYQRESVTWHRPTWRLGSAPQSGDLNAWVRDDLGLLSEVGEQLFRAARQPPPTLDPEVREAYATLDLVYPASREQIKVRYKELAKRYHPDANGGDKTAEERLKQINQAYTRLLSTVDG